MSEVQAGITSGYPPACSKSHQPRQIFCEENYRPVVRSASPTPITIFAHTHHHIHLSLQFRADLHWWKAFAGGWNGMAIPPNSSELWSLLLMRQMPGAVVSGANQCGGNCSGLGAGMRELPLRKCLQWWWQQQYGARAGRASRYEGTVTIWQWCIC